MRLKALACVILLSLTCFMTILNQPIEGILWIYLKDRLSNFPPPLPPPPPHNLTRQDKERIFLFITFASIRISK